MVVNMVMDNRTLLVQQNNSLSTFDDGLLASYQQAVELHATETALLRQSLTQAQAELLQSYNDSEKRDRMVAEFGERAYSEITDLTSRNQQLQGEQQAATRAISHWEGVAHNLWNEASQAIGKQKVANDETNHAFGGKNARWQNY